VNSHEERPRVSSSGEFYTESLACFLAFAGKSFFAGSSIHYQPEIGMFFWSRNNATFPLPVGSWNIEVGRWTSDEAHQNCVVGEGGWAVDV